MRPFLFSLLVLSACVAPPQEPAPPEEASSSPAVGSAQALPPGSKPAGAPADTTKMRQLRAGHGAVADSLAPTLSTVRSGDDVLVTVTFRTPGGVALSDSAPLLLHLEGTKADAALVEGPARFAEPSGTIVDQAVYRLDVRGYRVLLTTPTDAVTVRLSDGATYHDYPYISGDLIE